MVTNLSLFRLRSKGELFSIRKRTFRNGLKDPDAEAAQHRADTAMAWLLKWCVFRFIRLWIMK